MEETRKLVRRAVEQDLFGPDGLLEGDAVVPPPGYELERCIGRGGGGVVWLGRDTTLDRPVAIKFLVDARPADVERFRREARFAARLENPSIVPIYELGDADGRPYIAMQYIDGGNLGDVDLDAAALARVVRSVAVALRQAHAQGIVHRDIKPANILLDRDRRPFLTDFGIARDLRGELGETISHEGQVIGTPALMPPEQARGDVQAVDARSDVYAIGATLYYKLSGRYPFTGASLVDVLHAVIHEAPPLPRTFNAQVPRGLEAIVARCMHKSRDDRYQSVDGLIDDLDRFLADGPVSGESAAWFRRLVGAPPETPAASPRADADWEQAMEITRELAAWDGHLYRVTGSLAPAFEQLDSITARLDEVLAARPDAAWARFHRGVALFRRGRLAEAEEEMERAIDRVRNRAGAFFELGRLYLARYLRAQHTARKHLSREGVRADLEAARRKLEQAVVALQEARRLRGDLAAWHVEYAQAVTRLAESDFEGCVAVCDAILAGEPDLEEVWKLRGDAQRLAGVEPFESYDRALAIRRSDFETLAAKAEAHLERGQRAEAREALERACRIHAEHHDAAALLARVCLAEARDGTATDSALAEARRLAARTHETQPGHYDTAVTLAEILLEQARRGDGDALDAALDVIDRARRLEGCQNRVNLLRGRARLEQARRAVAAGGDPTPHLDEVAALAREVPATVPDNEPWEALEREAGAVPRPSRG
ncbi:MAG: protein kinase domain-containing protein [Planctomycetota bacterium]|jgi:serine/threonine-protein kinase